jgi:hypothetical protein
MGYEKDSIQNPAWIKEIYSKVCFPLFLKMSYWDSLAGIAMPNFFIILNQPHQFLMADHRAVDS